MAGGAETELKFQFAEEELPRVKAIIAENSRQKACARLHSVYFDTPRHDLWNHGFTLRVRAAGKSYRQGVKQILSSSITRDEWEAETASPAPDLEQIKASPLAHLIAKPSVRRALQPVFEIGTERDSFSLNNEARLIEASIDRGSIAARQRKLGICELELELKRGKASDLFDLARDLVTRLALRPNMISKAERGYLFAKGAWGRPAKASRPHLGAGMSCQEAFLEICRTCLHDFFINLPAMEDFGEAEGVHQGRIAIRRLRAALAFFKPVILDKSLRELSCELKWAAGLLGKARDLDVLHASLSEPATRRELSSRAGGAAAESCNEERRRARQALLENLGSERGRRLFINLLAWIEDGAWRAKDSRLLEKPVHEFARKQLKRRLQAIVRRGRKLAKLSAARLHKLRIRAKKLRYMAEFFTAVPRVAKRPELYSDLIIGCEKLQDALGAIRDEQMRTEFLQREGQPLGVNASAAPVRPPREDHQRRPQAAAKNLRRAIKSHSKLAGLDPF